MGCMTDCKVSCNEDTCDWTCPRQPARFAQRWGEVGGWPPPPPRQLCGPRLDALPSYVPQLQHASRFSGAFDLEWVALKSAHVIPSLASRIHKVENTENINTELRRRFRLSPHTKILLVSVDTDTPLEIYWEWHKVRDIPRRLGELGVEAMTVPNFSYFPEAPPWHTLWNHQRMLRVAEGLSEAGIAVIPHVNTLTDAHRRDWVRLLRDQPHLSYVSKEFQTGAKRRKIGDEAFADLRQLQEEVGRQLHPIVVGGARYWRKLRRFFPNFTVVDSHPFMQTVNRQRIVVSPDGGFNSERNPLPLNAPLDDLWQANYLAYCQGLYARDHQQRLPHTVRRNTKTDDGPSLSLFAES